MLHKLAGLFKCGMLSFRTHTMRAIITILVSAAAFSLFALTSTALGSSDARTLANTVYYAADSGYTGFSCFNFRSSYWKNELTADEVALIEEKTDVNYARAYYDTGLCHYTYFLGNCEYGKTDGEGGYDTAVFSSSEAHAWKIENVHYYQYGVVVDSEDMLGDFSLSLMAGRLPQSYDEIAIPECLYYSFLECGYYYDGVFESGKIYTSKYDENGNLVECPDHRDEKDLSKVEKISSPDDIIGKLLYMRTDSTGTKRLNGLAEVSKSDEIGDYNEYTGYYAKIVGVINTGCTGEYSYKFDRISDMIFLSKEWAEKFASTPSSSASLSANGWTYSGEKIGCSALITPKPDLASLEKMAAVAIDFYNNYYMSVDNVSSDFRSGVPFLISEEAKSAVNYLHQTAYLSDLFLKAVIPLVAFAVVLNGFFAVTRVKSYNRQTGILLMIGAAKKDIALIHLIYAVLFGLAIFLAALPMTFGLYFLVDTQAISVFFAGINFRLSFLSFNWMNIALLFGVSLLTPILGSMAPVIALKNFSALEALRGKKSGKVTKRESKPKRDAKESRVMSHLPFTVRLGAEGLIARPARFALTLVLLCTVFSVIASGLNVALYNQENGRIEALKAENCVSVTPQNGGMFYTDGYDSLCDGADAEFSVALDNGVFELGKYFDDVKAAEHISEIYYYENSDIALNAESFKKSGAEIFGELPKSYGEIALSYSIYEYFLYGGYYNGYAYEEISSPDDLICKDISAGEWGEFTVVGVVKFDDVNFPDSAVFVTDELLSDMAIEIADGSVGSSLYLFGVSERAAETILSNEADGEIFVYSDLLSAYEENIAFLLTLQQLFIGASIVLIFFAACMVYTLISLSIDGKKRQIGLIRALGGSKAVVWKIFLTESLVLGIITAAVSCITGCLSAPIIGKIAAAFTERIGFFITPQPIALIVSAVLAVGAVLVASVIPIGSTANKSPVLALRENQE